MAEIMSFEDLAMMRRMTALLRQWWGLELGVAMSDGYVASHARGRVTPPDNDYCRAALGRADTFQACNRSVEQAVAALRDSPGGAPRAVRVQTCHLGFPMLFVPLMRQGHLLASLFVGGFVVDAEADDVIATAQRNAAKWALFKDRGTPEDAGGTRGGAPRRVTRLSERDYQIVCDLMETLAEELLQWPGVVESLERSAGVRERQEDVQFEAFVGQSRVMQNLYTMISRVAVSDSTVLVTGEDGTGKELVAHAVHARSHRAARPFVIRNCSAFNDNLLESELFGHTRGAFTGADRDRTGVFEQAHTGTLFLDEVGDTSPVMQVKLLRALQDRTFVPVGGTKAVSVDVRFVAATNRPLRAMVRKGTFRKDLFYRLNVINLHLPPLRERAEDLPSLCAAFIDALAERTQGPRKTLSAGVMERFFAYDWPGNIRELQSEVERLYVLSGEAVVVREEYLSPEVASAALSAPARSTAHSLADAVAAVERDVIGRALVRFDWNRKRVAAELGISRTTLHKRIADFGLDGPEMGVRGSTT